MDVLWTKYWTYYAANIDYIVGQILSVYGPTLVLLWNHIWRVYTANMKWSIEQILVGVWSEYEVSYGPNIGWVMDQILCCIWNNIGCVLSSKDSVLYGHIYNGNKILLTYFSRDWMSLQLWHSLTALQSKLIGNFFDSFAQQ